MVALSSQVPLLMVRARSRRCGLPLGDVIETMRPLAIEPVAHVPAFVLGVAVVRGSAVPVIDLGALLGLPEAAVAGRFVTVRAGSRVVAVQVESVDGVHHMDPAQLLASPPLLRDARSEHVASLATLERELLTVLDGARLVPDEVWSALPDAPPAA